MKPRIYILGLGPEGIETTPEEVREIILRLGEVYLRTKDMSGVTSLEEKGILIHSFDSLYEETERYEEVYEEISARMIDIAQEKGEVLYLIPGHPRVAEMSVRLLEERGKKEGVEVILLGGRSFLDDLFTSLSFDPIEGFLLLDAYSLTREMLNPRVHTVILQMTLETASDVKLTLMERYPDEYEIFLVSKLGMREEKKKSLPLYRIDQEREWRWDNYTLLYLPPMADEEGYYRQFAKLREIIEKLRAPDGCPWDRKQTHQSLKPYLIEETYEVLDAIDRGDDQALEEELGDLLLQILLHSRIAEEEGRFHIENVIEGLSAKLIRRHPHVFGEKKANDVNEALVNWKEMKEEEKKEKGDLKSTSVLDEVKVGLPPLYAALMLQKEAAKYGFDWESTEDVVKKVEEEWLEFRKAPTNARKEEELGDLLFALVNLARFHQIDPESALSQANRKFRSRFHYIEERLKERGISLDEADLSMMDQLWQEAKKV